MSFWRNVKVILKLFHALLLTAVAVIHRHAGGLGAKIIGICGFPDA